MLPALTIDPARTAVLLIDLHRGHLDQEIGTMPVSPADGERVIAAAQTLIAVARSLNVPVIYSVLQNRWVRGLGRDGLFNPVRRAQREAGTRLTEGRRLDMERHNMEGSILTRMPEALAPEQQDYIVNAKRRLGSFYNTDMESLLRVLQVDTLVIGGINTNTCVHCAVFEAFNRDLKPIVVADCVASMYGEDLHRFALENIRRCIGWVVSLDEAIRQLRGEAGSCGNEHAG